MKRYWVTGLLAFAATLWCGNLAQAGVIVDGYYHLGESDSPVGVPGQPGNSSTVDSSGKGNTLFSVPVTPAFPAYSSSVAASATAHTGSNLSMRFNGGASGSFYTTNLGAQGRGGLNANTNNFGIEGWFNVDSLAQQGLALNGSSWDGGYGLYILGGHLQGLYGGVAALDSGIAPVAGTWFYAALVRDGGDTKIYYNAGGTTQVIDMGSASAPIAATDRFNIGSAGGFASYAGEPLYPDRMSGYADEVRVFHFNAGAFNAGSDLLINAVPAPEPSTLALLGMSVLGLAAYAWRKRK